MKNKLIYNTFFILLQIFPLNCPIAASSSISPSSKQDIVFDSLDQVNENLLFAKIEDALSPLMSSTLEKDADLAKRTQKRSGGRDLQKKGENFNKIVKEGAAPLKSLGTTAGLIASASGDPHAKAAAAAFRLSITAAEWLGRSIALTMMGIGRYQERSQEILSTTEILIEELQKSVEKIKKLQKDQKELLDTEKTPEASQSSSQLKRLGQNFYNASKNLQNKARQSLDVFTNEKEKRGENLKDIQLGIKKEMENFKEIIRLFQIKLLQDAIKEMDKKINIEDTISKLNRDIELELEEKNKISKAKDKDQLEKINKQYQKSLENLRYYSNLQKTPDKSVDQLKEEKLALIEKTKELTELTLLGESTYLQKKGIDPNDPQLKRSTIVNLHKEIDTINNRLEAIEKRLSSLPADNVKPAQPPALPPKTEVKASSAQPPSQAKKRGITKEEIIEKKLDPKK